MDERHTILVIEDDPDVLFITEKVLLNKGYRVITTSSGKEGIELAKTELPDLILLDWCLPDIDGSEVCRTLKKREETRGIMLIIVSSIRTTSEDHVMGLDLGADDYISRPIKNRELIARVNAMLRLKRAEDKLRDSKKHLEVLVKQRTEALEGQILKRRELEMQYQRLQRMESIGTLAGGIAHDFNNILFPIIGISEMLMEDLPDKSPTRESIEEIFNAAMRATKLVKQILAFSRQSTHQMHSILLQPLLKEVVKLMGVTIPKTIQIEHDIDPSCEMVNADATQIHQVIMNILTNAYHAVDPNHGRIQIRLKQVTLESRDVEKSPLYPGKYARLTISDNGCGISNEHMTKIFAPYFTTKAVGKGTGLGLSVAYGIVKAHKGEIRVHSVIGKQTTFDVFLPIISDPSTSKNVRVSSAMEIKGNERILLVDDEEVILKFQCQALERLGYLVAAYHSPLEALEGFKKNPANFDLVITDINMPTMNGEQLIEELRLVRKNIPVIICTGFSEMMDEKRAQTMGVEGFLLKPVSQYEISKMVREVLDG